MQHVVPLGNPGIFFFHTHTRVPVKVRRKVDSTEKPMTHDGLALWNALHAPVDALSARGSESISRSIH